MKLRSLLERASDGLPSLVSPLTDHPALNSEVKGLSTNSHACQPGDLFIGMPGTRVDGGEFWQSAIAAGAIAALISPNALKTSPPIRRHRDRLRNSNAGHGDRLRRGGRRFLRLSGAAA